MRKNPSKEPAAMADSNPHPNPNPAPSRVSDGAVDRAVKSLLKWRSSKSEHEKPRLLDDDEFVYLIVTLKKVPGRERVNSHKIRVPNPLFDSSAAELCLFLDDRHSSLTKKSAADKIAAESVPVSKILTLSKLRTDFKPFEAKRKLCESYDLFLADRRAVHMLPRLLGKEFFRRRKIPVPVDLRHRDWKGQIEAVCSSAQLFLRTGTCSVVRVARASMSPEMVAENVSAAIEGVASVVPKKWGNIRSFHVKLLESVALPVYQALPDSRLRIDSGVNVVVEAASAEEISEKKMKKKRKMSDLKDNSKGRIHEVRYMDPNGDADESDGGEEKNEDESPEKKKKIKRVIAKKAVEIDDAKIVKEIEKKTKRLIAKKAVEIDGAKIVKEKEKRKKSKKDIKVDLKGIDNVELDFGGEEEEEKVEEELDNIDESAEKKRKKKNVVMKKVVAKKAVEKDDAKKKPKIGGKIGKVKKSKVCC